MMSAEEVERLLDSMPLPDLERLLKKVIERKRGTSAEDWVKAGQQVMDQFDDAFRKLS